MLRYYIAGCRHCKQRRASHYPSANTCRSLVTQANTTGPAAVKAMILAFQRAIIPNIKSAVGATVSAVWNGVSQNSDCILQYPSGGDPAGICPDLPSDITTNELSPSCEGAAVAVAQAFLVGENSNTTNLERRAGASCTLPPSGDGVTISLNNGPTCANSCGGVLMLWLLVLSHADRKPSRLSRPEGSKFRERDGITNYHRARL